ncbi:DUF6796 family protein [uncultured Algibacter sp.]|uniref:DUF6796 family protein n=1 Tax=uncultured Algibacter sp. TaxID=298659 RepID=UPI0032168EDB
MALNKTLLRILGACGILGGLVLFAGDMLFYYHPTSPNLKWNMGNAANYRIIYSGISALVSVWLYMLGLGQVYYAFKPVKPILKYIVVASFGAILIAFGVIHGAFVAIATSAKLAVENNIDLKTATSLASETNNALRLLVYPIFAILSYFFITLVWKRKTHYPRWIIIFFPLIWFLLKDLITKHLSNSLWVIIDGGYLNLLLIVFFSASTIALWNQKSIEE